MKESAKWKREQRQRMREAGYVLKQIWVRPKDWPRVRNYIERLRREESGK